MVGLICYVVSQYSLLCSNAECLLRNSVIFEYSLLFSSFFATGSVPLAILRSLRLNELADFKSETLMMFVTVRFLNWELVPAKLDWISREQRLILLLLVFCYLLVQFCRLMEERGCYCHFLVHLDDTLPWPGSLVSDLQSWILKLCLASTRVVHIFREQQQIYVHDTGWSVKFGDRLVCCETIWTYCSIGLNQDDWPTRYSIQISYSVWLYSLPRACSQLDSLAFMQIEITTTIDLYLRQLGSLAFMQIGITTAVKLFSF